MNAYLLLSPLLWLALVFGVVCWGAPPTFGSRA